MNNESTYGTPYRSRSFQTNPDNYFKFDEIEDHFNDFLENHDNDFLSENIDELHHYAFNQDYYIIGTYKAEQWLGDRAFEAIRVIQDYETKIYKTNYEIDLLSDNDNFGQVTTPLSDPERVVNMYVYIVGERVVYEFENSGKLDYINPAIKTVPDGLIGNPA